MEELTSKTDLLMGRGRWDEAETLLLDARREAAAARDERRALSLDSELMGFYRMHGKEGPFLETMEDALRLLDKVRIDRRGRGTILINAATGLVAFGRAYKALELYNEAEALYNAVLPTGDLLFAALYNNMAAAFQSQGEPDRAGERMLRALDVLRGAGHHPDRATTCVNLAQLSAQRGDMDRAEAWLNEAMGYFNDPETVWDGYYAHTAQKCAGGFEELGRGDLAAELRERAEIIYEGT